MNTDDPANPYPYISAVNNIELFETIESGSIIALSQWDDTGIILFSLHGDTILGGTQFYRAEIIKFNPSTGEYTSVVNTEDILGDIPGNPNLELDCLAVLSESDPRLLLSFTTDAGVTGSDGNEIQAEDIAIWDPATNTINLHISMTTETTIVGPGKDVSIVSWEINP